MKKGWEKKSLGELCHLVSGQHIEAKDYNTEGRGVGYLITPGRIKGLGQRGNSLQADHVLEYRNTKLAVTEAKAWACAMTEGVAQAKNYADKLSIRLAYSTNGQSIYEVDMETGVELKTVAKTGLEPATHGL